MMDLEALLRAARDDEPDAWKQLAPVLYAKLNVYFLRWVGSQHCKELAQQTVAVIHEKLPGFEPRRSFEGWAMGIARNLAFQEYGDRRRQKELREAAEGMVSEETGLSSRFANNELEQIMIEEIEKLPEPFRGVMALDLNEGDRAQYAAAHGISVQTVRTRRFRALEMLRARMAERLEPASPSPGTSSPSPQVS